MDKENRGRLNSYYIGKIRCLFCHKFFKNDKMASNILNHLDGCQRDIFMNNIKFIKNKKDIEVYLGQLYQQISCIENPWHDFSSSDAIKSIFEILSRIIECNNLLKDMLESRNKIMNNDNEITKLKSFEDYFENTSDYEDYNFYNCKEADGKIFDIIKHLHEKIDFLEKKIDNLESKDG